MQVPEDHVRQTHSRRFAAECAGRDDPAFERKLDRRERCRRQHLVEMTPTGKVLDTKVVDKSTTQGIFGLHAIGTSDSNTALYYTDTNDNSLHELEQ